VNFYPFHIGDYLAHTSHLNDQQDLAYRRMMDWYYLNEKPFCPDIETIARLARATPETIILILADFFYQDENGFYHSKRADEELAKYKAMQDGGRKGAEKRWAKGGDSPPKHPPMQTKNQEPLTKNQIKTPEGVSDFLFKDYLEVRKAKKAKWTETAYKGLQREADKAKMSLSDVMQMCCERGWAGFKAEWVAEAVITQKKNPLITNDQIEEAYRIECGKDPKLARFNSYYEMKDYVIKQREIRARGDT